MFRPCLVILTPRLDWQARDSREEPPVAASPPSDIRRLGDGRTCKAEDSVLTVSCCGKQ
jgi:hypothetical protein